MKTKKIIYTIFLITTFMFYGCNQEDTPELCTDFFCSAVVKSAKIDNQLDYNLHFYLRTFAPIREINLTGPEGTFDLTDEVNSQSGIFEIKKTLEFGNQEPSEGTWFYNIMFADGQVKIIATNISKPYLKPVDNIDITMNTEGLIFVSWGAVEDAHYYEIKTTGSLFSTQIVPDKWNICMSSFDRMDFSWGGEPVDITFEITAFHVKGNPEKITSVSSAYVNFHIDEFEGWW